MAIRTRSSISTSDPSASILVPPQTVSSASNPFSLSNDVCVLPAEPSESLSPEATKTADVFQKALKRKSSAPQKSLSKTAALTQKEGCATLSDRINFADQATHLLEIALQEAQTKYQLKDFKGAIMIIDTILHKPPTSAGSPDIQELHFQLLKAKALSFFEKEKDDMSLENPATIDAALALLTPLQENKSADFEIQKALAYCFHRLSLCPSLSHMQDYYRLRADICYEKAHRLRPNDLLVVQDWMHFHSERGHYRQALHLLASVRTLLDTCKDIKIVISLLLDEAKYYQCLSNPARYNANDEPQKLCAYYRGKALKILERVEALMKSQAAFCFKDISSTDSENDESGSV
ncbi:MAG: hypothetical protein JSS10_00700 [Verrucomicrobia bacterium]|nr:hypothetical protein [Verrucomicrobiota bacterium]